MKIFILCSLILLTFCSCFSGQPAILLGQWKLTEELVDIGDGNGSFRPVSSEQIITFSQDGTFTSTVSFCPMPVAPNERGTGTYSMDSQNIMPNNCTKDPGRITFKVNRKELILNLPCFEPCRQKFVRVE